MTDDTHNTPAKKAWGRSIHDLWLEENKGISDPHDPPRYDETKLLYRSEWDLLEKAARGEFCARGWDCPSEGTDENTVRGQFLRFVALGGDNTHPLHDHGIRLGGAFIKGQLDFGGAVIPENLNLFRCKLNENIILRDCCAETVNFGGCQVAGIVGDRFEATGSVFLRNKFCSEGSVRLLGAKIEGNLDCSSGQFLGPDISLHCDRIEVSGRIFLKGEFQAKCMVSLLGAQIGGTLECDNGKFNDPKKGIECGGMETRGSVLMRNGFQSLGAVRLLGAKINGDFSCRNGKLLNTEHSLVAQKASIAGAIHLDRGFLALGKVDLSGCTVGGMLSCVSATFSCPDQALFASRIKVGNNVNIGSGCKVAGQISFQGAQIDGDLIFTGGSFDRKIKWDKVNETTCINLRNANVHGTIFWRDINIARGELNLAGASCRTLNMEHSSWQKPSQIRLDNFTYKGFNQLAETTSSRFWLDWISRQPVDHLTKRFRPRPYQQLADVLQSMGHEEEARVVRIERKKRQSAYTRLYERKPKDPIDRGYRHLINFWNLVQGGVIAHGYRPGLAVIWLLGIVAIGAFIYEIAAVKGIITPTHPLIFKEAVWTGDVENIPLAQIPKGKIPIGCRKNWVYPDGDKLASACAAQVPSEYSTFSSIVYSLDIAIPVVNFRMENDWSPRVVHWETGEPDLAGWMVRFWEWLQIGLGWMFSLLFVSAIGGIIRRD